MGALGVVIIFNGASGGLGRYLAASLERRDEPSHALSSRLEDQSGIRAELDALEPLGRRVTLIHLAALVSVPACEADPIAARRTNVELARETVASVINWAIERGASIRVIYVSTGHVYAAQDPPTTLVETAPTSPRSVYAQTKLDGEAEVTRAACEHDVPLLVARVFGLLAPRQARHYVLPSLIDRAHMNRLENIPGLDYVRDYLDARDVCDDLLQLADAPWSQRATTVNVCSGVPTSIRDLLAAVIHEIGGRPELAASATAAPGRPDDIAWLVGNPGLFARMTGSRPARIPLHSTVADAVTSSAETAQPPAAST